MKSTFCIILIVAGLGVFLVAGALAISLQNAQFLWVHVVPRVERLLMTGVALLGLLAALCGSGRLAWEKRAGSRRSRVPRDGGTSA
jgi:hypothetical protein